MTPEEKTRLLTAAQTWFLESVAKSHASKTLALTKAIKFKINPFLAVYLANFLEGNSTPESVAKALVHARALGTSIVTIFGTGIQRFTSEVLGSFNSLIDGLDIEFEDQIDGRHKYCQLKVGPNTINKDDVESIAGHFDGIRGRARVNPVVLGQNDLIVGVIYGEERELSAHYKRITRQYHHPVHIGVDFWHRLTGDENFYYDLIESIGKVAIETDFASQLKEVVEKLARTDEIIAISDAAR